MDGSLFTGQQVDCDLEFLIEFTPASCDPNLELFDANGDGLCDDGEEIVLDSNGNGIFD